MSHFNAFHHAPQDHYQPHFYPAAPFAYEQPQVPEPQWYPEPRHHRNHNRAPQHFDASGARRPYDGGVASSSSSVCESARPSRSTQVCLDWLKGICTQKRAKCKYAHPPLPFGGEDSIVPDVAEVEADEGPKVCEVYRLTGFCKFGAQCRDYHPPHAFTRVCAPPISSKMSTECRDAADAALGDGWAEDEDENEAAEEMASQANIAQILTSLRELLALATLEDFDAAPSLVERAVGVIAPTGDSKLGEHLPQCLPTLYSVAVSSTEKAEVVSRLCLYLFNLVEASQRSALRTQLINHCGKLLYHVEDMLSVFDGEAEARTLECKRLGNAAFIGHLFVWGVINPQFMEQVVEYLLERSKRADAEGGFHARLMCRLLDTCGSRLKESQPAFLSTRVQRLARLARRHPAQVVAEVAQLQAEMSRI